MCNLPPLIKKTNKYTSAMTGWRNMLLNRKLALSYGVLILVFLLSGSFIILRLNAYKKELSTVTQAYIPLVANTNKIERLTNQTMYLLREYTTSGDRKYYKLSKSKMAELSDALLETDKIISVSSELYLLRAKLIRITQRVSDLSNVIDESAGIQDKLKENQQKLKSLSPRYTLAAKKILREGENELWQQLTRKVMTAKEAKDRYRKNHLILAVVDKANSNMISAFESISFDNPEYLNTTLHEFKHVFILLSVLDTLTTGTPENAKIKTIRDQFLLFEDEVFSLKANLTRYQELSVKQAEFADIVIHEATTMGQGGILFAGQTLQHKYQNFDRLITLFYIGLMITLVIAIVFSLLITRSITIPLAKSVKFAEEIASGNLDASVQIDQKDEVGMLALSLRNMGVKLKGNMDDLKRVEREMLSLSIETEEKERKRFAEDLHDSLGPLLSIIKLFINALKDSTLPQEKKDYLINNADEILLEAITTAKNISYNLLPSLLSDFGLYMAIRSFCDRIREVSGIDINYTCENYPTNLNRHLETMLFRVVKELINNTIKHAAASHIDIKLYFDAELLHIDYADNGKGFDIKINHHNECRGLVNILNRVNYIKGNIDFLTSQGNGVKVFISVDKKSLMVV
jgi:signal transduction histidine kinase